MLHSQHASLSSNSVKRDQIWATELLTSFLCFLWAFIAARGSSSSSSALRFGFVGRSEFNNAYTLDLLAHGASALSSPPMPTFKTCPSLTTPLKPFSALMFYEQTFQRRFTFNQRCILQTKKGIISISIRPKLSFRLGHAVVSKNPELQHALHYLTAFYNTRLRTWCPYCSMSHAFFVLSKRLRQKNCINERMTKKSCIYSRFALHVTEKDKWWWSCVSSDGPKSESSQLSVQIHLKVVTRNLYRLQMRGLHRNQDYQNRWSIEISHHNCDHH